LGFAIPAGVVEEFLTDEGMCDNTPSPMEVLEEAIAIIGLDPAECRHTQTRNGTPLWILPSGGYSYILTGDNYSTLVVRYELCDVRSRRSTAFAWWLLQQGTSSGSVELIDDTLSFVYRRETEGMDVDECVAIIRGVMGDGELLQDEIASQWRTEIKRS
jgi:hypothetical protein